VAATQHPDPKEAEVQSQELADLARVIAEADASSDGQAEPPAGSDAMTVSWPK